MMRKPESAAWQDLYQAAIFETDLQKALERIVVAQAAIDTRLQQLNPARQSQEVRDMEYALSQLSILRRTML
jgi:hypothetical protein